MNKIINNSTVDCMIIKEKSKVKSELFLFVHSYCIGSCAAKTNPPNAK